MRRSPWKVLSLFLRYDDPDVFSSVFRGLQFRYGRRPRLHALPAPAWHPGPPPSAFARPGPRREMARVGTAWARTSESLRHQEASLSHKLGMPVEIFPVKFEGLALSAQLLAQDIAINITQAAEDRASIRRVARRTASRSRLLYGAASARMSSMPAGDWSRPSGTTCFSRTASLRDSVSGAAMPFRVGEERGVPLCLPPCATCPAVPRPPSRRSPPPTNAPRLGLPFRRIKGKLTAGMASGFVVQGGSTHTTSFTSVYDVGVAHAQTRIGIIGVKARLASYPRADVREAQHRRHAFNAKHASTPYPALPQVWLIYHQLPWSRAQHQMDFWAAQTRR